MADEAIDLEGGSESGFAFHAFHTAASGVTEGGHLEPEEKEFDTTTDQDETSYGADCPSQLLGSSRGTTRSHSWFSILTLDYYQGFFDVTTTEVAHRTLAGMVPLKYSLMDVLRPNPDLYGPFWLCMTLIFTTAISGNVSKVFQNDSSWEFHFHEVTVIGTAVYVYTWVVPLLIWAVLWWRGNRDRYTLLELVAIYGYCIAVFIPVTALWAVNSEIFRWVLLGLGATSSGTVLVMALWTPLKTESTQLAIVLSVIVFLMHALLAVGFKVYYFSTPLASPIISEHPTNNTLQIL